MAVVDPDDVGDDHGELREIAMGVAKVLDLDDPASPALVAARIAWARWCALDPDLAVVDELDDLPGWTARVSRTDKDAVLARLGALTEVDVEAVTVLTWLLLPGAVRIARSLGDLHGDVDGLVSGQLWIEASRAHELAGHGLARTILNTTRREVLAELGRGDLAKRRDRVWAEAVRTARFDEGAVVGPGTDVDYELEPYDELLLLEMDALADKAIADLRRVSDPRPRMVRSGDGRARPSRPVRNHNTGSGRPPRLVREPLADGASQAGGQGARPAL